jgi:predicted TIM-barrel fold metal-dependent hydrolase
MSELCQAPREVTRKPKLVAPKGACDTHLHIFGDPARYPFTPQRSYTPPVCDEAAYLRMAQTIGIERMVVVQASVHGFDNSCTLDAVTNFGLDRARAIVQISADTPDAELKEMHERGARGVRFITFAAGGAPLDQLKGVARKIAPYGWHIQMYVQPDKWGELGPIVRDLPVEVVLDHLGGFSATTSQNDPAFVTVLKLLETRKAWVKLAGYRASVAGHPFDDVAWLAKALIACAPERCVWGSDWPHPHLPDYMPDDGDLLDLLLDWAPDEAVRARILADNPARLYGFG